MEEKRQRFFYCPWCKGELSYKLQGERLRLTCAVCKKILYENPVVGVAAVILNSHNHILLGRRTGSYAGLWCIPCGYVEYNEDVRHAIIREVKEETNLDIKISRVFSVHSNFHDPDNHSVGIWFLSEIVGGELSASDDLDRVEYYPLDFPPPLAFPTDKIVIEELKQTLFRK